MAEEQVDITIKINGLEESFSSITEASTAMKKLEADAKAVEKAAAKTADSVDDLADASKKAGKAGEESGRATEGAMKVADEATGGLATKVKEVGGGLISMGKAAVTSFKGAVMGANSMKKALIATGIGALVVALGLIVAYWDDIVGLVNGVSAEQAQILADTQATAAAAEDVLAATEGSENSLRLAGKSEREIRDLKIEQTNEIIAATEAVLLQQKEQAKAQEEAMLRNRTIAQNVIRFLLSPITMLLKTVDMMTAAISKIPGIDIATNLEEGFSGGIANMLFDPEETAAEGAATVAETEKQLATLKNKRDGFILANNKEDEAAGKTKSDARQKEIDDEAAKNAALLALKKELNAQLAQLTAENLKDEETRLLKLFDLERELARKALEEKYKDQELLKALLTQFDEQTGTQRAAISQKFRDAETAAINLRDQLVKEAEAIEIENEFTKQVADLEAQKAADLAQIADTQENADARLRIEKAYSDKIKIVREDEADANKAIKKAEVEAGLGVAASAFDAISELAGESSAAGKAAAVASATINTYLGASSAYAQTPGGPIIKGVAAGVAVLAGLMQVKKILAVKVPGDKGGGGGGTLPTMPSAPTYDPNAALASNAAGQTADNQITLGDQTSSTGANVIKAYVVSSDMSSQQEADKKINDLARL